MSENTLRLIVAGKNYTGWKSVTIFRSMQNISGKFSLSLTDMVRGEDQPLIKTNDTCRIEVQPTADQKAIPILSGFVDAVDVSVGKTVGFTISGRDKTGDLVDCSVVDKSQWKGLKFEEFVQSAVDPFGITVVKQAGLDTGEPAGSIVYDQGDTVVELISKYAQLKQLLLYPLTDGRLLITRVTDVISDGAFVEGTQEGNILSYKHKSNATKVFSIYRTKGSKKVEEGETEAQAAQIQGEATDERVERFRPLLILPSTSGAKVPIQDRAEWEAINRRANAESYLVTIQGWLPIFNVIAFLKLPSIQFEGNMLISSFSLKFDGSGKKTELTFVHPDSFKPLVKKKIVKDDKDTKLNK